MQNKIITITLFMLISLMAIGCDMLGDTESDVISETQKLGFIIGSVDNKEGEMIGIKLQSASNYSINNFSYTIPETSDIGELKFFLSADGDFHDFRRLPYNDFITNITIWWDINKDGEINTSSLGYSEKNYVLSFTNVNLYNTNFTANNNVILFNAKNLFDQNNSL